MRLVENIDLCMGLKMFFFVIRPLVFVNWHQSYGCAVGFIKSCVCFHKTMFFSTKINFIVECENVE